MTDGLLATIVVVYLLGEQPPVDGSDVYLPTLRQTLSHTNVIVFASRIPPRPNRAQRPGLSDQRRFGSQRKSHRNAIGKSMECQREGTGKSSESHRTVIGKSSKSRQKVIGKSSECHRNVIGMSSERHPRNARRFYAVSLENDILRHSRS